MYRLKFFRFDLTKLYQLLLSKTRKYFNFCSINNFTLSLIFFRLSTWIRTPILNLRELRFIFVLRHNITFFRQNLLKLRPKPYQNTKNKERLVISNRSFFFFYSFNRNTKYRVLYFNFCNSTVSRIPFSRLQHKESRR